MTQATPYNIWTATDPYSVYLREAYGYTIAIQGAPGLPDFYGYGYTRVGGYSSESPPAPQQKFIFDTLGHTIYRAIGHCRLPLQIIWAKGITESGDITISNTQTFAAAICAPIDPLEEGQIFAIWAGGSRVFDSSGVITPAGWSPADAALLKTSLNNVVIYPGTETQLPASLIVADKGAAKTNAFRGIRYLIFVDFPISNGIPQLSIGYQRTNDPVDPGFGAVEFLVGDT